jgi:cytoskeletal protein CcmA (bactofilin family)
LTAYPFFCKITNIKPRDGDLDCLEIKVNGVLNETGSLRSNTGEINGSATVKDNMESDDISVNGELKVDGNMSVDKVKSNGRLIVKGDVSSEELDINGEFKVNGKCEVETFNLGAFNINEMLNVGEVNVKLYGSSETKEIGGSKIHVQKGRQQNNAILGRHFQPAQFL